MSAVVKAVTNTVKAVVKTVEDVIEHPVEALVAVAGMSVGIPPAVTYNTIRTAEEGGDLGDIAKSAALSYVANKAAPVVSQSLGPTVSSVITNEAAAAAVTAATSEALVNGSLAAATGGDFGDAAMGSFAGSLMGSGYEEYLAPSVAKQAANLGLEASTISGIQKTLSSSLSSGAEAAATGGDFVTGFSNAFAKTSLDTTTSSLINDAKQGIKSLTKTAASDYGVDVNEPTDAGIPQTLVAEVPMSSEGEIAQERIPSVEEQYAQAMELPADPNLGRQLGPAFAASQYAGMPGYDPANISGYETFTDNVPEDVAGTLQPLEFTELTDDALKRAAITGDAQALQNATNIGEISPMGDMSMPEEAGTEFNFNDYLRRINQKASESASTAIDAQVQAMINPTPENIAAAQEAQMAAELDQNALSSALQESTSVTELPKTSDQLATEALNVEPPYKTSDVLATEALAGYTPPVDQFGLGAENIIGNVPTVEQGVTGGAGNLPYDPSTDLAAFGGSEPSYGGSLPGQEGIGGIGVIGGLGGAGQGGTEQGGAGQSGAGQGISGIAKTGLNAIQAAIAAAAGSGGRNFIAPSSPLYETTTAYQRKSSPLIDMQSNIYMSPQEYAARSQLSNLFKVARGGLITLKNLR